MADEATGGEASIPLSQILSGEPSSSPKAESTPTEKSESTEKVEKVEKSSEVVEKADEKTLPVEKTAETKEAKDTKDEKTSETPAEKTPDTVEKRLSDTQAWAQEQRRAALESARKLEEQSSQIAELQKRLDGTWTDEDELKKLNSVPTIEDISLHSQREGAAAASLAAAIDSLGEEHVQKEMAEFNQLFNGNRRVQEMVLSAKAPVHKALEVLDRYRFEQEFGSSPKAIKASMEKHFRASLEKEIREKVVAEIREGKKQKDGEVLGLSDGKGGGSGDSPKYNAPAFSDFWK